MKKNIPAHVAKDSILQGDDHLHLHLPEVENVDTKVQRTDMTITGKMNPEGDTIFLRVQIADKQGK